MKFFQTKWLGTVVFLVLLLPEPAMSVAEADSMSVEATLNRLPAEERLQFLHDETQRTIFKNPQQAMGIATRYADLARQQKDDGALTEALMKIGLAHYLVGEYQEALRRYEEALVLARQTDNNDQVANAMNNIGVLYFVWGQHDLALDHYLQTLELRLATDHFQGAANCYNNIAGLHHTASRYDSALEYYNRALELYQDLDEMVYAASTMNNIGLILFDQAKYDQARVILNQALVIEREIGDQAGESLSLTNLGMVRSNQGQYEEAEDLFNQALTIRRQLNDILGQSMTMQRLGEVLVLDGQVDQGIELIQESLTLARELESLEQIRDVLLAEADAWEKAGKPAKALASYRQYKEANDRLFDEERTRQMAASEARYEADLKDKEIAGLQREAKFEEFRRRIMVAGAAFLVVILALLWNRYRFQKRAHGQIKAQNDSLAAAHTQLKKAAREQLAHVARVATMGELTAAFAHELHQPLTAIKTNARAGRNLLKRSLDDGGEVEETLADISDDADRARKIISRLREMMRKGEEKREVCSINQIVESGLAFVDQASQEQGVALRLELDRDLPQVSCDQIQLQQVLLNLIQNGLAAVGSQQGEVVVRTGETSEGQVEVQVIDSGPPVSDEVISEMFDPFFTTKDSGLGMGLPICRTIIEAHGGKLTAVRNKDHGLTLLFRLPEAGSVLSNQ